MELTIKEKMSAPGFPGFLHGWNLYNQFFYDREELEQLEIAITHNATDPLHKFMSKLMDDNLVSAHIEDTGLLMTVKEFRYQFITVIINAYRYYLMDRHEIIEDFIVKYDFVFDDVLIKNYLLHNNMGLIFIFNKYYDMKKYPNEIHSIFIKYCRCGKLEDIKKILNLNLDIVYEQSDEEDSPLMNALHNPDTKVLKFLMELYPSYKKYESELVKYCVVYRYYEHLKILIEYGADITTLNSVDIELNTNDINIYKMLTEHNINPLVILSLFMGPK